MSEWDTSVAAKAWQDPAVALQIAGMLAPNVTHTRNTLYGPRTTTIDIRNALSGFGQMYGGFQQKRENEDLMAWMARRAAEQQRPMSPGREVMPSEPNEPWSMGEAQGASTLPSRTVVPRSLMEQAKEVGTPVETSAQFYLGLNPKQREAYMRGMGASGQSPMISQFEKQRAETMGLRQRQQNQIGLQAMERVSANPADIEASQALGAVLGDMKSETVQLWQGMLNDQRFRISAAKLAKDKGLVLPDDPSAARSILSAVLADEAKTKGDITRNHAALDALEMQWKERNPGLLAFMPGLRALANAGQPLNPEMLARQETAVAFGQLSQDFSTYADSRAAWKPLGKETLQAMQAKPYWPAVQAEVIAFQQNAIHTELERDKMLQQTLDRQGARDVAAQEQEWRQVTTLATQADHAQKNLITMLQPEMISSQSGWLKNPTSGSPGEVTEAYKKNFLFPAQRQYDSTQSAYEAARRQYFITRTPRTTFMIDTESIRRDVAKVVESSEPAPTKLQRLQMLEDIYKKKPDLRDAKIYPFGPQVLAEALSTIASAREQIQKVSPPPSEAAKTARPMGGGPSFTEKNAENQTILAEILARKHPGFRMDQLRWEDRQAVIAELNTELARRHGTLREDARRQEAEVAQKRAAAYPPVSGLLGGRTPQSFAPPVGAMGP